MFVFLFFQAGGLEAGARDPHRPLESCGVQGCGVQRDEGSVCKKTPLCSSDLNIYISVIYRSNIYRDAWMTDP